MQKIKLGYASNSTNTNLELARTFDIGYLFMETLSDILYIIGKNKMEKLGWKYFVELEDDVKMSYKWYLENK